MQQDGWFIITVNVTNCAIRKEEEKEIRRAHRFIGLVDNWCNIEIASLNDRNTPTHIDTHKVISTVTK